MRWCRRSPPRARQADIILLTHRTIERNTNDGDRADRGAAHRVGQVTRIRLEELGRH
jgi:hypothetical protein